MKKPTKKQIKKAANVVIGTVLVGGAFYLGTYVGTEHITRFIVDGCLKNPKGMEHAVRTGGGRL